MNRAYNYEFKMHMEGIEVPFKSANIVCTPNGVEMNVNVHVCEELFDIKPKTAVQIFFREWYSSDKNWLLMGDGFFSAFVVGEDSIGGRSVALVCRDFRMDIRKSPAAIAWMGTKETPGEPQSMFSVNGVFNSTKTKQYVVDKKTGETTVQIKSKPVELYDQTGLMDLSMAVGRIAGAAYGEGADSGNGAYDRFKFSTNEITDADMGKTTQSGKKYANGGLFLDAFIKGLWLESVGGTTVNAFLNKRIRADKRFLVPRNYAGFNFWMRNNFGLEVGSAIMGNSRFSSLEAAMMNVAGMFSCRVHSCSTPSLISIENKNEWVIDENVRKFLIDAGEFGAPFVLNQTMLLPPFEFTAPPNCNLFFPPMYDRISWQYDHDSDITRGYFGVISSLQTPGGADFGQIKFQIPNDMFGVVAQKTDAAKKRLPLTLEERYKGINVYHGSVEYNLAAADAAKSTNMSILNEKGKKKLADQQAAANKAADSVNRGNGAAEQEMTDKALASAINKAQEEFDNAKTEKAKEEAATKLEKLFGNPTATAYKRHAMIKYINMKYSGRVVTVDMAFNPFVMCGFPGAIISANEEFGTNLTKTIIGMVQQVSHNIYIAGGSADATTTVIMNNARFEDEPTDLDADGLPLYIQPTVKSDAEVDINTGEFVKAGYMVPKAESPVVIDESNSEFDLKETEFGGKGYRFVKDFLSTSAEDLKQGKDENIYVDRSYEPNRIFHFYKKVFGHAENHFMIGSYGDGSSTKYFAYNSMHEAFTELRKNHPELLSDYYSCINFVKRNICSADAFFHGILGLSSLEGDEYVHRTSGFKNNQCEPKYWGISTNAFNGNDIKDIGISVGKSVGMTEPGQFSSIRENMPITAFILERIQCVEDYRQAAVKTAVSTRV